MSYYTTGNTYLENLIAMAVFAMTVVGITTTQIHAVQINKSALYRTKAVLLARSLSETLRANPAFKLFPLTLPNGKGKIIQTEINNRNSIKIIVAWGKKANSYLQRDCSIHSGNSKSINQFSAGSFLTGCHYLNLTKSSSPIKPTQ